jgi:hypothetical protein
MAEAGLAELDSANQTNPLSEFGTKYAIETIAANAPTDRNV